MIGQERQSHLQPGRFIQLRISKFPFEQWISELSQLIRIQIIHNRIDLFDIGCHEEVYEVARPFFVAAKSETGLNL